MKIVFVSYGRFDSNSGGHMAGFANRMVERGHRVAVFADGDPQGDVHYEFAPLGTQPYWTVVRIRADLPIGNNEPPATPEATLVNVSFTSDEPAWMFDPELQP